MLNTRQLGRALAVAALALVLSPLMGQTLYRCGNQFSQTPCAIDAASKPLPAGAMRSDGQPRTGDQVCAAEIVKHLQTPVGFTTSIVAAKRGPAQTIKYANETLVTRTFDVTVTVRNGMGATMGNESMRCFLSEDEQRVLKTGPAGTL